MSEYNNQEEETFGQRLKSSIVGLFFISASMMGIGALSVEADRKEDERLREKLSDDQVETITVAAGNDTCGSLHPRLHRICMAEQRDIAEENNPPSL